MTNLEQLGRCHSTPEAFSRAYLDYLASVMGAIDVGPLGRFIEELLAARERGAHIYFIGNGGSASSASHFANDMAVGSRSWARPFRAMSLTDNVAVMTAIANDYGYEHVFTLQLKTCLRPDDVVVAISVSGNSPNVVRAVEYANAQGAVTVGVTGGDGGRLKEIARLNVHVPTCLGEFGPAEDCHLIINHVVGTFLMNRCRSEAGAEL
jgi:D-sedoheptulose 7-phosphate isomerase